MAKKGPKIYRDVLQDTKEWFLLRSRHFSASTASAFNNKGITRGMRTLISRKMREWVYGEDESGWSGNASTEHGKYFESVARERFEKETGYEVEEVGFIEESEYVGISPDGIIGDLEGVEIKCFQAEHHLKTVNAIDKLRENKLLTNSEIMKKADKKVWSQIQWSLMVSQREAWWFVAYHPVDEDITEAENFRYIRVERDEQQIAYYRGKLECVIDLLKEAIEAERGNNTTVVDKEIEDLFGEWS